MERQPPALVCGFTIQGLAVARALARHGVSVHAFAGRERWRSATTYTRYARVHFRDQLNTDEIIGHLQAFARTQTGKIVLFPTSDRMVSAIGRHWPELEDHYLLSWAHCRELVVDLQQKDRLPGHADRTGTPYPPTAVAAAPDDAVPIMARLRPPVVVKPAQPLSAFKAMVVRDAAELRDAMHRYPGALPFVVQEFIEGGDGSLHACTVYLDHGREVCAFTSCKLAAYPQGLGMGTIFVAEDNAETLALTRQFLAGLDLSGPVALEFKRDPAGAYWLIEPNVGRTEHCVDLAIQSGFNLPCIEYRQAAGLPAEPSLIARTEPKRWFDTDKDPLCFLRSGSGLSRPRGGDAVFPFAGHDDRGPAVVSTLAQTLNLFRRR